VIEKEIRFLARAPRFRLVFTMGFTFGLVIWLPISFGRGNPEGFLATNYLTMVSLYAVLLLGDVCFWNVFGFDRSAAQAYWAMPVKFGTVMVGKNIAALFFVLLDITLIVVVCALLQRPMTVVRVAEAYAVSVVVSLYLIALGNVTSTSMPRPLNPSKAMRSGSAGRLQAMLLLLYPVAALPALLAFGARYAFDSEAAFFLVLLISALVGGAVYWVGLDSAVETAAQKKEQILTALSQGEGLIQG
jgi:ABC-2 type transport system permease protein